MCSIFCFLFHLSWTKYKLLIFIQQKCISFVTGTFKPVHAVTSIKYSPVLKGLLFLVL